MAERRPGRVDRGALVQAAMGRGGQGGGGGFAAAIQQFMASFSTAMSKMTTQMGKAQEQQVNDSRQLMANVANAAEQAHNRSEQKAETGRQEARQDVLTGEARQYQLGVSDYQNALQRQIETDAKSVALLLREEEAAKERVLAQRETDVATIAESREAAWSWITQQMDANNQWDLLPDGLKTREEMLDLIRMSGVVQEDYHDSPYSDRLHALVAKAQQAIVAGEPEYESVVGMRAAPPMLPIPASMLDSLGLDLPILSREEMREWENRNGYPKGGVWAMKTDDPKLLMVNPVGFSALMAAKQQDTFLAITGAKKVQRDFLLAQAKKQREWDEWAKPLEDAEVELTKQFNMTVPEAVSTAFAPPVVRVGGPAAVGTDPRSLLRNIYSGVLKDPNLIEKAMRLGLPEGDPNRWVPGLDPDPSIKAQDFYDVQRIKAADNAVSDYLSDKYADPAARMNVSAWLGHLSEAEVWNLGLSEDVASTLAELKRRGGGARLGSAEAAGARKTVERAISQVMANLNAANREQIGVPAGANSVMQVWRDNNHAATVLQDGTAVAMLSRMEPSELQGAAQVGRVPERLLPSGEEAGLFRAPVGILKGVAMLNSRPGARVALTNYVAGGLTREEEEVFGDDRNNQVQAYYKSTAANGLPPNAGSATAISVGTAGQRLMRKQPYLALTKRLHDDRTKMKMLATQGPEQLPAAAGGPPQPGRPTLLGQPPQPSQAEQAVPPAVGSSGPQVGELQQPMGETPQLAPPPMTGPIGGQ